MPNQIQDNDLQIPATGKPPTFTTHAEAIIHFIKTMDIEMIDTLLDDKLIYQNFEKCEFMLKLKEVFELFKTHGDTDLICHAGVCNGCNKGCKGFSFIGNHSDNFMDIMLQLTDGKITNVYTCTDFVNDDSTLKKNRNFYVEVLGDPSVPW